MVRMIESGAIPAVHGVVRWRLIDRAQWIFEEFGMTIAKQTLSGELRAMGYRKLWARPRHYAQAAGAIEDFKRSFLTRLDAFAREKAADSDTIEIWFSDEARIGQKNRITRRWAKRGTRPSAARDQGTASTDIFGAVCPERGRGRSPDQAGVVPERIAPGKPQQNGRLERLHLTLLQDTANPPARSLREQLDRLRRFQDLYNEERPHAALGNDTPSEHYALSPRRFDGVLREPDYGDDHAVRRVRHNGEIKWQGNSIYISEALAGELVGLIEDEGGDFTANYGPIVLGVIAHGGDRLRKPKRHARGLVDNAARCPQGPRVQQQQT